MFFSLSEKVNPFYPQQDLNDQTHVSKVSSAPNDVIAVAICALPFSIVSVVHENLEAVLALCVLFQAGL